MNFRVLCGVLTPLLMATVGLAFVAPPAKAEDAPQNQAPTNQPPMPPHEGEPADDGPHGGEPDGGHRDGGPDTPPHDRGQPQGDHHPEGRFKGWPDGRMGERWDGQDMGQHQGFGPQFPPRDGGYRGGDDGAEHVNRRRDQLEGRLRALIGAMGFPDTTLQNAVIQHIEDEEKAMTPVRASSRALMDAMRDPNVSSERLTTLLNNLHVALEADKLRRKEAQLILDNKIGYSRSPRLEAMLTLLGVLDDSPSSLAVRNSTLNGGALNVGALDLRPMLPAQNLMRVAPPAPNAAPTENTPKQAPKLEPVKDTVKDAVTPDTTVAAKNAPAPTAPPTPAPNK